MSVAFLNAFCRRYDLVFVEMGQAKGAEVYWFLDFNNSRRYYTKDEIYNKMGS